MVRIGQALRFSFITIKKRRSGERLFLMEVTAVVSQPLKITADFFHRVAKSLQLPAVYIEQGDDRNGTLTI